MIFLEQFYFQGDFNAYDKTMHSKSFVIVNTIFATLLISHIDELSKVINIILASLGNV